MKSDVLLGLIKETVKKEVKQQVKEELIKLVKSGIVSINKEGKQNNNPIKKENKRINASLNELMYDYSVDNRVSSQKPIKQITKNPLINEILSQTIPFTAEQRRDTGMVGGSILDAVQPAISMENEWETMDFRNINTPPVESVPTDNPSVDALTKALTRDYRELVKRF